MRLIDADRLKEWIQENNWVLFDDSTVQQIEYCIDSQPTAYDLDKVVEQLDDYMFDKYCVEGDSVISEIIKGGGVDE